MIIPVMAQQRVGIHTSSPAHNVHITQPAGTNLSAGQAVSHIEYTGVNAGDVIAVKAKCKPADFYGIGGDFEGGYMGLRGKISGGLNQTYFGLIGECAGSGTTGNFYGLKATALGAGKNYAVYGNANGGTTNWAGYFDGGNVYIKNKVGIGQLNPAYPVHINQPEGSTLSGNQPVLYVEYTGSNQAEVIAIKARSKPTASTGIGCIMTGGWIGGQFEGGASGVVGLAYGTGTVNRAIYGNAEYGSENWAGYFSSGNVFVENRLGIGRSPATHKLEVEGNASKSSPGDWVANSDARLKKNIHPLDHNEALEKLMALRGITYEWNDDRTGSTRPEGIQYGFTAQNIGEVFPELVEEDATGYLQTSYGTFDAMTVEAIRALYEKLANQQAKIALLEQEMERLAMEIRLMKDRS
jgi:hypothetical protein